VLPEAGLADPRPAHIPQHAVGGFEEIGGRVEERAVEIEKDGFDQKIHIHRKGRKGR
jgi:hypothetical protein